jgi:hypothetical protein
VADTERTAMLRLACPKCGSGQWEHCISRSGRETSYMHVARWYAVVRERKAAAAVAGRDAPADEYLHMETPVDDATEGDA